MLAIAKDNFGYQEYLYTNWKKGNEYECCEDGDLLRISDERGEIFIFTVELKDSLDKLFNFI